ncbi:CHAT domain-containing protein [Rhodococcus aetherivorans]
MHLDIERLLHKRDAIETTVLASTVAGSGRGLSRSEDQLRRVGLELFTALFSGEVAGAYRASLGVAQQRGERLRVVLRLTVPQLAALPWEALFDPETGHYICRREPLVRHVPAPYTPDPLEVDTSLRVLGLVASPRGLPPLDVSAEQDRLSEALAGPITEGRIELEWLAQASWEAVQEKLLADHWHVLHFIGYGDYDLTRDQGLLALVGPGGRANLVEAEALADLLDQATPTPRLVVLNSCSSGEAGTQDLFSGTAAALVHSGISAVAAMQFTISDSAALAFARGFYTALAHGRGVDEAVRSGRVSILGAPNTLEWVTPVLYVRGETSQLFTLAPPRRMSHDESPAVDPDYLRERYLEARAELRVRHYDTALALLDDLFELAPGYRDTATLRETAARKRDLSAMPAPQSMAPEKKYTSEELRKATTVDKTDRPKAFLSYTRIDDEFFGGAITKLRRLLELGVQVVTGDHSFTIFQDIDGIELGQKWEKRINEAISTSTFLIPIVTPLFFASDACRDELNRFIEHEKTLGREDLILPIYFQETAVLEKPELLKSDPLAREIASHQRYDWRIQADLPADDPKIRAAVLKLAKSIAAAMARTATSVSRAAQARPADEHRAHEEISELVESLGQERRSEKSRKLVLWVDDNPDNNVYERRSMAAYNINFVLALSTGKALAELRKQQFDAIISDMGRPPDPRAGYTLLEALRDSGDQTPYFIYAGSRDPEHVREALTRGAQGTTNRPDELLEMMLQTVSSPRTSNPPPK